jgi:predicted nucleic acid-binding Zn ribbon protein
VAKKKKREFTAKEKRRMRIQQIIFIAFGVLIILSFIISSVAGF